MELKVICDCEQKTLLQPGYIKKLLNWHNMLKAKSVKILMQETLLLLYKKLVSLTKKTKYMAKIGYIIYAIVETWIDIAFVTLMVSCFAKNLRPDYFSTIDQILRYLVGSQDKAILFGGKS